MTQNMALPISSYSRNSRAQIQVEGSRVWADNGALVFRTPCLAATLLLVKLIGITERGRSNSGVALESLGDRTGGLAGRNDRGDFNGSLRANASISKTTGEEGTVKKQIKRSASRDRGTERSADEVLTV